MNQKIKDDEEDQHSIHYTQQSAEILVLKNLLPPPLVLLPKIQINNPNSLLPMLPLPNFVGIIPFDQPLELNLMKVKQQEYPQYSWIGTAFTNVVYKKYNQTSYEKIDNVEQNWNMWVCDISKLLLQKPDSKNLNVDIKPYINIKDQNDKTLVFESRFESGNLSMASKISNSQYNLLLQNDINTTGYSHWFFFRVSNTKKDHKVKFNILNLSKENSLYKSGMKIITYSTKQSLKNNLSWHRAGQDISYFQNGYSKSTHIIKKFYTLTWTYIFQHDDDEVYFAYNYPFTYSNLEHILQKLQSDPSNRQIMNRSVLCKTLAKNQVELITITQYNPIIQAEKPYIIISARVHSGETVSSYVINGIINYLLSNNEQAKKLRKNFIFKIVPMLNPDGVIHGNYRSNLSGFDLNKKWENPSKIYHPQIYYFKKMILNCHQESEVLLFCDLHGHSMKKSAFVYGCHNDKYPYSGKQFPFLVSKLFRGFQFKNCSFINHDIRQETARSILSKQLDIENVFTLQSSFCGPQYDNIHFSIQHFQELGQKFCEALLIYFEPSIRKKYLAAAFRDKSAYNYENQQIDIFFDELYQSEEYILERINTENSQCGQQQIQSENLIDDKIIKKFILLETRSISEKKKRKNQDQFRKKIKLVIHRSLTREKVINKQKLIKQLKQFKQLDLQIERLDRGQPNFLTNFRKKKQQSSKPKNSTIQKIEQNKIQFNILQKQSQIPIKFIKSKYNSEKAIKKKKMMESENIFNSKLKMTSKFEFIRENQPKFSHKKSLLFQNGSNLTESSTRQKAMSKDNEKKMQLLKLEIKGAQNKKIKVQQKIKTRENAIGQKYRINNFIQSSLNTNPRKLSENNIYKSVLDSLKKVK